VSFAVAAMMIDSCDCEMCEGNLKMSTGGGWRHIKSSGRRWRWFGLKCRKGQGKIVGESTRL
jgi:hypothetical protein